MPGLFHEAVGRLMLQLADFSNLQPVGVAESINFVEPQKCAALIVRWLNPWSAGAA